jgi:hypothetical protein
VADLEHRPWRCSWIWAPGGAPPARGEAGVFDAGGRRAGEQDALLRRRFVLAAVPARALARVAADSRYALFVNGALVSRGPIRCDATKLHYDPVDLAPHLRPGENVLAIRARYYGTTTAWWAPARATYSLGRRGCVAFELDLGGGATIGSDASWKALRPDAWAPLPRRGVSMLPVECVDARRLPVGWTELDFDDSAWPAAEEIVAVAGGPGSQKSPPSAPYGALRPRPIPQLEGETFEPRVARAAVVAGAPPAASPVESALADEKSATLRALAPGARLPLRLEPTGDATLSVLLDFGRIVCGLLGIEVEAEPGVTIDLAGREEEGHEALMGEPHVGLRYVTRGRDDRFETFDPIGLRFAAVSVRGATRPLTLRRVACRERLYPVRPGASFSCSDPVLDRVYDVGRRTVALNAHDAYLDCPTREQRAWTGDSVVHQMVHLTTNADWGLARWHPQLASSPRPDGMLPMAAGGDAEAGAVTIPEWALHWIRSVWNLWRYTGDRELVRGLLPAAEGVLRWFLPYRGGDGLIRHVEQWVLVDWAALHLSDTSSCLNAQWARALLEFAETSEWLGDAGRAGWARGLHAEVRRAFELFWDEGRGGYVDCAKGGVPQRPMSQHAGATAVWAGLVPPERVAGVIDTITDPGRLVRRTWMEISGPSYLVTAPPEPDWDVEKQIVAAEPFYRYMVHDAVVAAGFADRIAALCRDWAYFLERGETTWPELWRHGTHCHGWSSTPTRDLVQYVLGIRPEEPGFAVARVAPRLGDLAFARGAAPTPHGFVRVDATRDAVEVESPVPVLLDLPGRAPERLAAGRHRRALA